MKQLVGWIGLAAMLAPATARGDESLGVLVRVDAPRAVNLEQLDAGAWRGVCVTPCEVEVARTGTYRVVGEGLVPSSPFSFEAPRTAPITVSVRPAAQRAKNAGIAMIIAGGVIGLTGSVLIMSGLLPCAGNDGVCKAPGAETRSFIGLGAALGGVALALIGALTVSANARTELVWGQ